MLFISITIVSTIFIAFLYNINIIYFITFSVTIRIKLYSILFPSFFNLDNLIIKSITIIS
jgi:hypothetical protein